MRAMAHLADEELMIELEFELIRAFQVVETAAALHQYPEPLCIGSVVEQSGLA